MVVSAQTISSSVTSLVKDLTQPFASFLCSFLHIALPCLRATDRRCYTVRTVQLDKNMPSRCSTKVTSSATTSSTPLSPRKIPSFALALAIRALCVYTGLSKMIGVFVSPCFLSPPRRHVAGHLDRGHWLLPKICHRDHFALGLPPVDARFPTHPGYHNLLQQHCRLMRHRATWP